MQKSFKSSGFRPFIAPDRNINRHLHCIKDGMEIDNSKNYVYEKLAAEMKKAKLSKPISDKFSWSATVLIDSSNR